MADTKKCFYLILFSSHKTYVLFSHARKFSFFIYHSCWRFTIWCLSIEKQHAQGKLKRKEGKLKRMEDVRVSKVSLWRSYFWFWLYMWIVENKEKDKIFNVVWWSRWSLLCPWSAPTLKNPLIKRNEKDYNGKTLENTSQMRPHFLNNKILKYKKVKYIIRVNSSFIT